MNLSDVGIFDIVFLIVKILIAIGILYWFYVLTTKTGNFLSKLFEAIVSILKAVYQLMGFRPTFWNVVPLIAVYVYVFSAIFAYFSPHPNSWLWWQYGLLGILVFGVTLGLNIYVTRIKDHKIGVQIQPSNDKLNDSNSPTLQINQHDWHPSEKWEGLYCENCSKKIGMHGWKSGAHFICNDCYMKSDTNQF